MISSTLSTSKSAMLAVLLALSALSSTSLADKISDNYDDYVTVGNRISIQLPRLIDGNGNDNKEDTDSNIASSQNISYTRHIFEMTTTDKSEPANDEPSLAPTVTAAIRYYATWTEGQLCSSKSSSSFELWEESFGSLSDCCEEVFGWDYDSCCDSLEMGGCL